jgi:uncharacterized protein with WD repeat
VFWGKKRKLVKKVTRTAKGYATVRGMEDKHALANMARSKALTGVKRSAHTRARMSAMRIVKVLKKRPESELNLVYEEQLRKIQARERVLAALEEPVENPVGQ